MSCTVCTCHVIYHKNMVNDIGGQTYPPNHCRLFLIPYFPSTPSSSSLCTCWHTGLGLCLVTGRKVSVAYVHAVSCNTITSNKWMSTVLLGSYTTRKDIINTVNRHQSTDIAVDIAHLSICAYLQQCINV